MTDEEKPVQEEEDAMQVDSTNGTTNGTNKNERRELFEKVVGKVGSCYERQTHHDQYWLKEWFAMVVRMYGADVAGMEGIGWVGEMLTEGEDYRKRFV